MIRTKLAAHTAVVEGEKLTLHCVVFGTDPEITWTIHGEWKRIFLLQGASFTNTNLIYILEFFEFLNIFV